MHGWHWGVKIRGAIKARYGAAALFDAFPDDMMLSNRLIIVTSRRRFVVALIVDPQHLVERTWLGLVGCLFCDGTRNFYLAALYGCGCGSLIRS